MILIRHLSRVALEKKRKHARGAFCGKEVLIRERKSLA